MSKIIPKLSIPLLLLLAIGLSSGSLIAADQMKRMVDDKSIDEISAVVEAVNAQNRIVTLRSLTSDAVVVMAVGDEVRNLAQVEVGDRVMVEFVETLGVDLKKGGGMQDSAGAGISAARAAPGEKPGGAVLGSLAIVATILAIDADAPSVTLRGPEGKVVDVPVRHPERLKEVDVGDQVRITYTRAMAVAITPSPVK